MSPATAPRPPSAIRVLVADAYRGGLAVVSAGELALQLTAGDLVVVNDAATLPASLRARTADGARVELRLVSRLDDKERGAPRFTVVLLGEGDWRTRTEDRPLPPRVDVGARLVVLPADAGLSCEVRSVSPLSPRLVEVELSAFGASLASLWSGIYRAGRPVQYAYMSVPLELWDVQTAYASRPWAVEMPSAGRALDASTLGALRHRGVAVARVTHAAGLSSTGDLAIDAHLPLPERYDVPDETSRAIAAARASGGRVLAVGTSVVRALEAAARSSIGAGVTDLRLGPASGRRVVDGLLTGVHAPDTSHFALLGAFASREFLEVAYALARREGLLGHEFGDAWLVWGSAPSATLAA